MAIQSINSASKIPTIAQSMARIAANTAPKSYIGGAGVVGRTIATVNTLLPVLATGATVAALIGGYMYYRAYQKRQASKEREYPKPNAKTSVKARTVLSENKEKFDSFATNYLVPGRKNATAQVRAWAQQIQAFRNSNSKTLVKSNIMVYGPTGTGKSYLAQDIANQAGMTLYTVPSYASMGGGKLFSFSDPAEKLHNVFQDILSRRDNGANMLINLDEIDQYLGMEHELHKFIEACAAHNIPIMSSTNNPALLEIRTQRRLLNYEMLEMNCLNLGAPNGIENAKEAVQTVLKNKGIKAKICDQDLEKLAYACIDTKSPYLGSACDTMVNAGWQYFKGQVNCKGNNSFNRVSIDDIPRFIIDSIKDVQGINQNSSLSFNEFKRQLRDNLKYTSPTQRQKAGTFIDSQFFKEDMTKLYQPLCMSSINAVANLIQQYEGSTKSSDAERTISTQVIDHIKTQAQAWANVTDEPVYPTIDSGVGNPKPTLF